MRGPFRSWRDRLLLAASLVAASSGALAEPPAVDAARLPAIGTVDARFQSYNIEMVEVTGGWFWKPYRSKPDPPASPPPPGIDSRLFKYRPPIDLRNSRLRKLAAALGPAFVRVSGTWANSTYFADKDDAPPTPAGFKGVLTRAQWYGVIDFARAVDAAIVTSFSISAGTRDSAGLWTTDQAKRLLEYTFAIGGRIAAAEFINEPDLASSIGGAPPDYDAAAYARDFKVFEAFIRQAAPGLLVLGPGTSGGVSSAADLMAASVPGLDVVSYHHYGTLSERCIGTSKPEAALSEPWLSLTDRSQAFYRALRDRYAPGKPIWLTETAQAACGGDRWAASFLDTFRYLDQLGRLAKAGVQVVMHNTLAASDYGLLDENTMQPRPDYWGALVWRRLMGTTVLDSGVPLQAGLHVYAHCQRGTPGGVALLVINTDRDAAHALMIPMASLRYTLDAADLGDRQVRLNGRILSLGAEDELPTLAGMPATANTTMTFGPATISFLAIPGAGNEACR